MGGLTLLEPTTVAEAVDCLRGDGARLLAGGTAVAPLIRQRLHAFATLVSLRRVAALHGITAVGGDLVVGAMASLWDVAASPEVRRRTPGLAAAVRVVGNVRVRSMATLGGNLSHGDPRCDPPAALLGLDAAVELHGAQGPRRLPVRDFFRGYYETALQPGEILTHVRVPSLPSGTRSAYVRFTVGSAEDWPCVAVFACARVVRDTFIGLRVALIGTGPRPQLVDGIPGTVPVTSGADVAALAAAAAEPVADLRGSEWYKREMIRVHTRRALAQLAGAEVAA